ncbi:MAG: helix-turn-helix transcriptional regulator [Lachnospiraceae bacterium]|nr:helix-turn-helix transcriptional regulator [Lachnospiraceae bacterium]
MNDIGKNIKNLRVQKDITQEQLAEKLHVTRQAVSNWENGKTQPDIETLSIIAECFEVSAEELIYGKKEEPAKEKNVIIEKTIKKGLDSEAVVGIALAVVLSYTKWHSIGWAIVHGFLNWAYVIYYAIRYA